MTWGHVIEIVLCITVGFWAGVWHERRMRERAEAATRRWLERRAARRT